MKFGDWNCAVTLSLSVSLFLGCLVGESASSGYGGAVECPYPFQLSGESCLYAPDDCADTDSHMTWLQARAFCQSLLQGADLAAFQNTCQYEQISSYVNIKFPLPSVAACNFWIGVNDVAQNNAWEIVNSHGKLLPLDDPFWQTFVDNDQDYGSLQSDNNYKLDRVAVDAATTMPLCQIPSQQKATNEARSYQHAPQVLYYPIPYYIEETDPIIVNSPGPSAPPQNGDETDVSIGGSSYTSDNTASFSSAPEITVNTHHHHVEKHPKVIIIPTYNPPPHHQPEHGYGTQPQYNDPHIVINHDHYEDPHARADTPEHVEIDGDLHPMGIDYEPPHEHLKSSIIRSPLKKPPGLLFRPTRPSNRAPAGGHQYLKHPQPRPIKRRPPSYALEPSRMASYHSQGKNTRKPFFPPVQGPVKRAKTKPPTKSATVRSTSKSSDDSAVVQKEEKLEGRTADPMSLTAVTNEDSEKEDLITQLLFLIDQLGREVPYRSIGNQDTSTMESRRLHKEKKRIQDGVRNSLNYRN